MKVDGRVLLVSGRSGDYAEKATGFFYGYYYYYSCFVDSPGHEPFTDILPGERIGLGILAPAVSAIAQSLSRTNLVADLMGPCGA